MSESAEKTVRKHLRPIDRAGLLSFAEKGRNNPNAQGTNKVQTVVEGQYRTISHVRGHEVVVDEPLHLLGQDTAPAPAEVVLSALGGCLAVGIIAVATWKEVTISNLELHLEGDIGNPAAWGAGGHEPSPEEMGIQAVRVKVDIDGDASREVLDEIVQRANYFSPVGNTVRNSIDFEIGLVEP